MPAARSPADILCLALYTLAGGEIMRGFMVQTVASRLGVSFEAAEKMAIAADAAGLVRHQMHTVALTDEGQKRGATLTARAKHSAALAGRARAKNAAAPPSARTGRPSGRRSGSGSGARRKPAKR